MINGRENESNLTLSYASVYISLVGHGRSLTKCHNLNCICRKPLNENREPAGIDPDIFALREVADHSDFPLV